MTCARTGEDQSFADFEGTTTVARLSQIASFQETESSAEFIVEALGPNISNLRYQCPNGHFNLPTCYKIVIQLVERLRTLHELNFIHNDVKLENILVGHHDTDRIYLIDFGLASHYKDEHSGMHIEKINLKRFSGNFMFTSLNALRGNTKSRRDDIEAAIYVLIYLINKAKLPWSDFEDKFKGSNKRFGDFLRERLKKKYSVRLLQMVPAHLQPICKRVLCLNFEEEPPYDAILKCLQECFEMAVVASQPVCPPSMAGSAHVDPLKNYVFEWNRTVGNRFRMSLLAQDKNKFSQAVEVWVGSNNQEVQSIQSHELAAQNRLLRSMNSEQFAVFVEEAKQRHSSESKELGSEGSRSISLGRAALACNSDNQESRSLGGSSSKSNSDSQEIRMIMHRPK
eukprot:CAMPEP_0185569004 /NCGR_PEP_ID=MMETSP0434-20130131/1771_1 /TAXON_ID=626734 ORGANISM="Favella taraikaensis, Strain Fe Narragansett Bay" /NCGR_SAMPLE_ID=MMETSP0434 /ASSEMBLY_ACC=CAM_ASM_000379 /LENGTH=396 /DNA_ID=CAMNT_0028183663 /DNA_START=258 /DNA_END=1450 /DNA_ORIENTATION=+